METAAAVASLPRLRIPWPQPAGEMGQSLYSQGGHQCLVFTDLVDDPGGAAVQANQCLIVDNDEAMLLDPGGVLTYNELYIALGRVTAPKKLRYVFASHQDPDIVASLARWLTASDTKLLVSRLWSRFVPHFCPPGKTEGRIVPMPDRGGVVTLGRCRLLVLPAHFLHAEGNLQLYDSTSRILFSGDLGASLVSPSKATEVVRELAPHLPHMAEFHRRYMNSNRACRLWAAMARRLPIEMIVPQHGAPLAGAAVAQFIDWIETLACGVDLMSEADYQVPTPDMLLDARP